VGDLTVKRFLPVLFTLMLLAAAALPPAAQADTLDIAGLPRLILANDPSAGASTQTTAFAWHTYKGTLADALPKVDLSTAYSLGYTPLIQSQTIELFPFPPTQQDVATSDQGTHVLSTKLSVQQILPTAGSLLLSLEDAMTVNTLGAQTIDGAAQVTDPQFSQKPRFSVAVTQPLFLNGKLLDLDLFPASLRKAHIGYLKEEAGNRDARNRAVAQGVEVFLSLVQQRKSAAQMEQSLVVASQNIAKLEQNFKLGAVAEADLLEAKLGAGNQKAAMLDLRYSIGRAERLLARSIGRESLADVTLSEALPGFRLQASPEQLLEKAALAHPLIQQGALASEEKGLDDILAGQRSASTLSLSFSFSPRYPLATTADPLKKDLAGSFTELFRDGWGQDYSLSANLGVKLFDGGKLKEEREGARALRKLADESLAAQRRAVRDELEAALMRRANLEEKTALLSDSLDLAERRLQTEINLLSLGRSTDLDVLSRRVDREAKANELWKARADLFLVQLTLASAAGEDLGTLIEGL
jgi:outer membrane protein TolC